MLADQRQLLAGLRQLAEDVLDEVMGGHGRQVPLQLAQHHQLPLLGTEGGREEYKTHRLTWHPGLGAWHPDQSSQQFSLGHGARLEGGAVYQSGPKALKWVTAPLRLQRSGSTENNESPGSCCQDGTFFYFSVSPAPRPTPNPDLHSTVCFCPPTQKAESTVR